MSQNPQSKIRNPKTLIVICGPTAIGKTKLAIDVAKRLRTEIISADSRQFYREMSIGTAKPTPEELSEVPHHFINNLSIHDKYTAGDYEREALDVLDRLFKTHDVVVMVGGSGLFIRAVCEGFDSFQSENISDEIIYKISKMTSIEMLEEIRHLDPEFYCVVDAHNTRRLQRALEVLYSTGRKYSEQRTGKKADRPFSIIKVGLKLERDKLYDRINKRVDQMIADGLWQEAEQLYPYRDTRPLLTVGYREIFASINGETTKEEAIDLIKQNSRRYAKRQLTWFNKEKDIKWFSTRVDGSFIVDELKGGSS